MPSRGVSNLFLTSPLALFLLLTIIAHCVRADQLAEAVVFTLLWLADVDKGPRFCGLCFGNGVTLRACVTDCITHVSDIWVVDVL